MASDQAILVKQRTVQMHDAVAPAGKCKRILLDMKAYNKTIIIILTPILASPLLIFFGYPKEAPIKGVDGQEASFYGPPARCAFCVVIMAIYWMFEVMPLAVTAFMPTFLFPLLQVLTSAETCPNYLTDTCFLFIGGLILAAAVEKSNLHQRIALRVLTIIGSQPHWIMFGFMFVTAFLSMWISNTATTAMMEPIARSVIHELVKHTKRHRKMSLHKKSTQGQISPSQLRQLQDLAHSQSEEHELKELVENDELQPLTDDQLMEKYKEEEGELDIKKMSKTDARIAKGLLISICFAANIGGTGTITGTPPNLVAVGQLGESLYPGKDTGIGFMSWMQFSILPMFASLIMCWVVLVVLFTGARAARDTYNSIRACILRRKAEEDEEDESKGVWRLMCMKYEALPPPSFAEISVLSLFLVLLSLWILRDPKAWPGFGPLFDLPNPEKPKGKGIKCVTDATSAMLIAVILFVWPSRKPDFICSKDRDHTTSPRLRDALMDWPTMQKKFPWSVVILLGGGFALAAGVNKSGLSDWVGVQLQQLSSLSPLGIQVVCVVITMAVTNVTSNTVTASIFIPIVNGLALKLGMNPLSLIIPTTLACSYAFLLPVATPPNAIVFAGGLLTVSDMIFAGAVVSIVSVGSIILFTNTFMNSILALDMFPEWALDKLTPDVLELVKARNMTMTYY